MAAPVAPSSSITSQIGNMFGSGNAEEKEEFKFDAQGCIPSLTYQQRMWGFGLMFGFGCAMSVLSAFMTPQIIKGHPERFAIPYTFASLASVCSTMFLMGPKTQCKRMFEKSRWIATTVFLLSMLLTIVVAFAVKNPGLVLVCVIIQACALFWYALSYIPYGRAMFTNCCKSFVAV
eukprot:gb/GEZN01011258.1/.p1 GENE.gb/GEZN01011258.1/~~gb/GEZN01011258.1/.p1  ORF type:complete len:188 (-),score=14.88 gb/GEZN01011258.1/:612-1139(-)